MSPTLISCSSILLTRPCPTLDVDDHRIKNGNEVNDSNDLTDGDVERVEQVLMMQGQIPELLVKTS